MAQMKEQSKTSERDLSDEDIANLSDGEFKALVIKMLTELTDLGQKRKESKIFREPTVTGRKPGLKSMIWNKRKK